MSSSLGNPVLDYQDVTIAQDASLSGAANVGEKVVCGLMMPGTWTAADISFQISYDGGATWVALYDDASVIVKVTGPGAGKYLALDPSTFAGVTRVKVQSGVPGAAVNQAAARTLTLVSRKFYALR